MEGGRCSAAAVYGGMGGSVFSLSDLVSIYVRTMKRLQFAIYINCDRCRKQKTVSGALNRNGGGI